MCGQWRTYPVPETGRVGPSTGGMRENPLVQLPMLKRHRRASARPLPASPLERGQSRARTRANSMCMHRGHFVRRARHSHMERYIHVNIEGLGPRGVWASGVLRYGSGLYGLGPSGLGPESPRPYDVGPLRPKAQ